MSLATDPEQRARYEALLKRVEDGFDDPLEIGSLRQDIQAMDPALLDPDDRLDLLGRCDLYIGEGELARDPGEIAISAGGPVPVDAGIGEPDSIADPGDDDDLEGDWKPA